MRPQFYWKKPLRRRERRWAAAASSNRIAAS
jgi:hypothetical protein